MLHVNSAGAESKIGPADAVKFQYIVWTGLIIGAVCTFIFHIFVKEANNYAGYNVRGGQLRHTVGELLRDIKIYHVAIIYMATRLFVNLSQVFIPLYLHETLNMTASALALIPLIMFIGSFLTSLTIEKLNRGFGRKVIFRHSMTVWFLSVPGFF